MKKLILTIFAVGSITFGLVVYFERPKTTRPAQAGPVGEAALPQVTSEPQAVTPARPEPEPATPAPQPTVNPPAVAAAASNAVSKGPRLEQAMLSQLVDTLVSPQATYAQKQEAWKQLRQAGKLDQAITELEQRMANDPRTAEYPAALGQAYLQKCATIQDVREQGILAMQADKVFDTALSLDPANWEARFTKAVALSYWPANLNKGDEVIQHFLTLEQQQEAVAPQPQFAQTYVWLGEQYQKAGRSDDARAAWQRGAALFPNDEKLQGKLTAQ